MPWRLRRFQTSGHLHFITFSCRGRLPFLGAPESRNIFVAALEAMRVRSDAQVHGYVVMPEHVHILISEPHGQPLTSAIQGLKQAVSHYMGNGPLWTPRYYDFNVISDFKRIEKLRYMHRNPVQRGLVAHPDDWPWSSFHQYATHEAGIVRLVFEADRACRAMPTLIAQESTRNQNGAPNSTKPEGPYTPFFSGSQTYL